MHFVLRKTPVTVLAGIPGIGKKRKRGKGKVEKERETCSKGLKEATRLSSTSSSCVALAASRVC